MTIFDFMHAHMVVGPILFLFISLLISLAVRRAMRNFVVMICGWPPEHLDADGRHGEDY
ncbi:hypothetical protein HNR39_002636 [Glaciimonas immobilis]|uniref:Uncharacterized protein n=1 Tax=Glaciimonas immobilis TaxID=728004 RepID=A0A840RVU8_9BURK|nr:hypothetical protein [Glaciimonas immobilis]